MAKTEISDVHIVTNKADIIFSKPELKLLPNSQEGWLVMSKEKLKLLEAYDLDLEVRFNVGSEHKLKLPYPEVSGFTKEEDGMLVAKSYVYL